MRIYRQNIHIPKDKKLIFTLGMFDGVHLGHQFVINYINEIAKKEGGESILMTFEPHPRFVVEPNTKLKLITTLSEKIDLLESYGVDNLYIQEFTNKFRNLTAEEFVKNMLVDQFNIHSLVIGYDHHLGKNREGNFEQLKEYASKYNFKLHQLPPIEKGSIAISSTKIRKAIEEGAVKQANEWLSYIFSLTGKVVEGDKIGRTIGFPTANMEIEERKIFPKNGVYFVRVKLDNMLFSGMMNIGVRPTVNGLKKQIEVHILNFQGNIYGKIIEVYFYDRVRDEQKFTSLDELKGQLNQDKKNTIEYFKK